MCQREVRLKTCPADCACVLCRAERFYRSLKTVELLAETAKVRSEETRCASSNVTAPRNGR
jgi:hypothetical protein